MKLGVKNLEEIIRRHLEFALEPVEIFSLFNIPLPPPETNWVDYFQQPRPYLRLYVAIAASGILRVVRRRDGEVIENLNSGNPLVADAAYMFDIQIARQDWINFRYSASGANILYFRVLGLRIT